MFMRMYVVFLDFVHPALLQFFHFITFGAGNQMDSLQDMMDVPAMALRSFVTFWSSKFQT